MSTGNTVTLYTSLENQIFVVGRHLTNTGNSAGPVAVCFFFGGVIHCCIKCLQKSDKVYIVTKLSLKMAFWSSRLAG